jgi:NAD(P)-dependent dehydrogenase (short-subunit alcohol dehydrogenase family)
MRGLRGRPVLVTGAASGIGEALCTRLAEEGAAVALLDRDRERLAVLTGTLERGGARVIALAADVANEDAVREAVAEAARALDGLGGVVTSAGIFRQGDRQLLADVDLETFERTLRVNLVGTFLAVKYALPHVVRRGGAVVTIASTAGLRGHGLGSGYTASKGGVIALTRLVAEQYGPHGVRANCICPGATDTPMTGGVYRQLERIEQMRRAIPLGRVALPHEIGDVAAFLLSDDAAHVTGQVLGGEGGATAR